MLSSSASVRKRVEEHARSMPSFILDSDSLDNYRPWMKRVREWARRQGGTIMENHLIGEVVPASDLTPETIAAADVVLNRLFHRLEQISRRGHVCNLMEKSRQASKCAEKILRRDERSGKDSFVANRDTAIRAGD